MYSTKVPKSQKPDNGNYTIHHCHHRDRPSEWNCRTDYYRVLSIDPGLKNFCFRIEFRNLITGQITMEAYEKINLLSDLVGEENIVNYKYRNSILLLEKYIDLIYNCHLVIIERQLSRNYKMVRFSQHLITYLIIRLMDNPAQSIILEVDPKLKTRQLNAPRGLNSKDVKKWAILRADQILKTRGDQASLNIIKKAKSKKDDLSDTVIQIEAIFSLFGLPITQVDPKFITNNQNSVQLYNTNTSVGSILPKIQPSIQANQPKLRVNLNLIHETMNTLNIENTKSELSKLNLNNLDFSKLKIFKA